MRAPREVHFVRVEALAAAAHVRRRVDRADRARKGHQAPALVLPHLFTCSHMQTSAGLLGGVFAAPLHSILGHIFEVPEHGQPLLDADTSICRPHNPPQRGDLGHP